MTTLKIVELPKPEPLPRNEGLIEALKTVLAQAEQGHVVGMCLCYLDENNACGYIKGGTHNFATVGVLHIMAQEVVATIND